MLKTLSNAYNSTRKTVRGQQSQDVEAANTPKKDQAPSATDGRDTCPQLAVNVGNDTPHEARPRQPTLTNRLFKAHRTSAPVYDIEMGIKQGDI